MKKNYLLLPLYNDWKSLNKVLLTLNQSFSNLKTNNYIYIINDNSNVKSPKFQHFKHFKSLKIINLKKNIGSQKAIFFGLMFLQKKLKNIKNDVTISVLDSDGEDNPKKLKKMISLVNKKKNTFIFASRTKRTEDLFLRFLNQIRLILTYVLTGKYINIGNFSSFSSNLLKDIMSNNNLYLAYSSGVLKNYNKFYFYQVEKNKRFYGKSKVNFKFLLIHSINIIAVFYVTVFFRTTLLLILSLLFLNSFKLKIISIIFFLIINLVLVLINIFCKSKKLSLSIIKKVA